MLTQAVLIVEPFFRLRIVDCGLRIPDSERILPPLAPYRPIANQEMNDQRTSKLSTAFQSATRNPQSAILLVFAAMLTVSWRRWTSPIADSGREMDLPVRLLQGEWLYRDVHHIYPPFAPYFNALLYRVFGVHLDVLHVAGIVCSAIIAALCYRIARRLFEPVEAAIATIAVVIFCIFKPAGNLIQPYAFAALYGCVCSLGVLLLTLRHISTATGRERVFTSDDVAERRSLPAAVLTSPGNFQRSRELILAGLLIGLAAITKQEFALAGAATVTASLFYQHLPNLKSQVSNLKFLIADLLLAALPALLIALPVYGWMFAKIGWQTLVADCHLFYTHLPASLVFYNAQRTGLDRPLLSLAQIIGAAAVAVAALSFVVMLGDRRRKVLKWSAAALVSSFAVIAVIKLIVGNQWDGSPLRALPVLLLAIIAVESWRTRRGDETEEIRSPQSPVRNPALLIIAVYSFAILARVALRVPSGGAFGGFFLPTSLILFCYLFWKILPDRIGRWTGDEASANHASLIGRSLLVVTILIGAVTFGIRYRKNFSYEILAERGHLFAPRVTGTEISDALDFIRNSTQPNEDVAIFPEGSDLAFLTGRRMPLRHQILIPGLMSEHDEQEVIRRLQQDRVHYVLIVNRPMREFGQEAFGRDFYTQLGDWIETNYRLVKVCGRTQKANPQIGDSQFFIKVFQQRD